MTDPIIVVATFTPLPGVADALADDLALAVDAVHRESGCLLYALHRGSDGTVVMVEKWESRELLDQHTAGTAVELIRSALAGRLAIPQQLQILAPQPAGDPIRGAL